MQKVRVLWPKAFLGILDEEPAAGAIVSVEDFYARELTAAGSCEPVRVKAARVEQATAAPGEKRLGVRRKK